MKLYKSQSGFTAVHVLLFLIMIGIIGFAGWKVYDLKNAANTASSNTPASVVKNEQSNPVPTTIPEGFVEYQNKELDFKFVYPKEWGQVKAENMKDSSPTTKTGERYLISFVDKTEVTLGLVTRDWSYNPSYKDGPCGALGFMVYKKLEVFDGGNSFAYSKILDSPLYDAVESFGLGGMCSGFEIRGQVKFDEANRFAGVQLVYEHDSLYAKDENEVKDYKENPNKYFPDIERQKIINVIKSVKKL